MPEIYLFASHNHPPPPPPHKPPPHQVSSKSPLGSLTWRQPSPRPEIANFGPQNKHPGANRCLSPPEWSVGSTTARYSSHTARKPGWKWTQDNLDHSEGWKSPKVGGLPCGSAPGTMILAAEPKIWPSSGLRLHRALNGIRGWQNSPKILHMGHRKPQIRSSMVLDVPFHPVSCPIFGFFWPPRTRSGPS